MKYIDLFAGLGGFRYALDRVGMDCVFTSEIDKVPKEMYSLIHGDSNIAGDIYDIDEKDVPEHDLLVGGITCQSFSTNGRRKGFYGATGDLFFEVIRVAKEKKPKYILIENVTGLLSNNKSETISVMMNELSEIGYTVDFTTLSSIDFGLPQQRIRVFIVAVLDGKTGIWEKSKTAALTRAKAKVLELYPEVKTMNFPFPIGDSECRTLEGIIEKDAIKEYLELGDGLEKIGEHKFRVVDGTVQGYTDFYATPFNTTIDYAFMSSKTRRGRVKQGITKTLDQPCCVGVYDGNWFRRITSKEAFRLQGFDDSVHDKLKQAGFSETQLYARPSRSVSIPVVEAIGEAILKYDKTTEKSD